MEKQVYDLTTPQKSIWLIEQFYPNTNINNIGGYVSIDSKVDFNILKKAINTFVKNNSGIRHQLIINENTTIQYIKEFKPFDVDIFNISNSSDVENIAQTIIDTPFSLIDSPLYHFSLYKEANGKGGFFVSVHHIILDAWSMGMLVSGILSIYTNLLKNIETDEISYDYTDFIESDKNYLSSEKFLKDKQYWHEIFEPELKISNTPNITRDHLAANRCEFDLSHEFTSEIIDFCKELKTSPFTLLLTIMGVYESKINGQDQTIISSPILNRSNVKEKNTFGMFINNILYKLKIDYNTSFSELLSKTYKNQFSALRHQKYPFQWLLNDIKENIYSTAVSYQNTRTVHESLDIKYSSKWLFTGHSSVPLLFHIYDFNDTKKFSFIYDYQIDQYNETEIEQLHKRIIYICKQIIKNKDILIKDIQFSTPSEKSIILNDFNDTYCEYEEERTIIDLFKEMADNKPDKIALVYEDTNITFNQLDKKSSQIASYLSNNYKLNKNSNIAIILDKSAELIYVLLGILKTGCSYLLIDPLYPEDRIEYMITNSDSSYIISNLDINKSNVINLENADLENCSSDYDSSNLDSSNNMYILYTSGSTGNPKGVIISHKNYHNYFVGISKELTYSEDKKVISLSSVSFDVFSFEVWCTLLNGLTLVIPSLKEQTDFNKLNELIIDNEVSILYGTPSKIYSLINSNNSSSSFRFLKDIGVGGEPLTRSLISNIRNLSQANIYNMYGPTETTVGCSIKKINENDKVITIGYPMANMKFYVLDKNLNICPPGISGELYISGDGVSSGYYNNPELTESSFIKDIFNNKYKMYKSGDIVRWSDNGELIFSGREDFQIKIRGYRIEVEEIQNVLTEHPLIKNAVVIKHSENNRDFLCAYYTSDFNLKSYELKLYLAKNLPSYMIPSYFIQISHIPVNINGKVDRKQLPSPLKSFEQKNYVKPETQLQALICDVLQEALSMDKISINEDFIDLGIDSLNIIKIQALLSKNNIVIPIQYFYDYTTIKDLCFALQNMNETNTSNNKLVENDYSFLIHDTNNITVKDHLYKDILLTGCTGFLGIHILDELLQKDCTIHCIIRSSSTEEAKNRLYSMLKFYFKDKYINSSLLNKIVVINGDITNDNLGQTQEAFDNLGNKIDLVIHSAALVKHYAKYEEFENLNINGTQKLINFCTKYTIPLNYISTTSVSGDFMPLKSTKKEVSYTENDFFIGQNYNENYYIKSKLLAEECILKSIANENLQANIFRVGNLTGRHNDGVFQYNIESNSFYSKLQFIIKSGLVYESSLLQKFDLSPVDDVAKIIVEMTNNYGIMNKIFHVFNPNKLNITDLIKLLKQLDIDVKIVKDSEFYKEITHSGIKVNSVVVSEFNLYTNISKLNIQTVCDITNKYMENINISYNTIDINYLNKLIQYMKYVNFL